MARVEAFTIEGLTCWFYSNDHRPPHFHVKRANEWEARIFFLEVNEEDMIRLVWKKSNPSKAHRDEIMRQSGLHRADLLAQWERIHGAHG